AGPCRRGGGPGPAAPQHRGGRVDGAAGAVVGLVRAGAGADVHDARRGAERGRDSGGQPRIGTPMGVVAPADRVVQLTALALPHGGDDTIAGDIFAKGSPKFAGLGYTEASEERMKTERQILR